MAASLSFLKSNDSNDAIQLLLVIDQVEKLAGIKMVMIYDKDAVKFTKAEKTEQTSSLMHVVNDKVPGKIVVVMAGAKGISGKNISLMRFDFSRVSGGEQKKSSIVQVTELQLMSDDLKDIKGSMPEFRIMPSFDHHQLGNK